jgi:hypothetical protein
MPVTSTRNCTRCRQPLPEGTGYCVACGCTNDAAYEKMIANENQIEVRQFWLKLWSSLSNIGGAFRWFR